MSEATIPVAPQSSREIVSSRVFPVAPQRLFQAFCDPDHLAHWWGPKGFSNTFREFDLRPGGHWRFTMHGPDGRHYDNESRFIEVIPSQRIVFRHESVPHFEMTITLQQEPVGTRLSWRMRFDSPEECERIKRIVIPANEENFDRLEAELGRMT